MAVVSTATSLGPSPAGGTSLPSFSPSSSNSLSLPSLFLSLPNKPGFLSVGRRQQRMGDVTGRVSRRAAGVTMSLEAGVGVMGTKLGMMTYFEPQGAAVPVTVVGFREGNIVTQVKTGATDGYEAVQVGYRRVRDKKLTKPELGHLQKAGTIPMRHLQEFRLQSADGFEPGQKLAMEEIFKEGDLVDVSGTSIGKGFQGATTGGGIYAPTFSFYADTSRGYNHSEGGYDSQSQYGHQSGYGGGKYEVDMYEWGHQLGFSSSSSQ